MFLRLCRQVYGVLKPGAMIGWNQGLNINDYQTHIPEELGEAMASHALWTWRNKQEHGEAFLRHCDPGPFISQRRKDNDE